MKAGVIGYPIKHSKSPIIHGYWLDKYNIKGSYDKIEIHPDNFESDIQKLVDDGYGGFNVTVPYKEKIISLCDEVDETAKNIGAVNTVIIKDKKLYGKNTDAYGFIQNIKQKTDYNFQGKKVLVIGSGGASRAILYSLLNENVSGILLTNRTKEKAEILSQLDKNKIKVIDWNEKENYLSDIDLLVNTTSLGMVGQHNLEIDLNTLNESALVTDIVYTPLMTDLLIQAKNRGNDIVTGIGMLLHQARPAFESWTGTMPSVTPELESLILK